MPELPEVHTIVMDLKKYAVGAIIKNVLVRENYSFNLATPSFIEGVTNKAILHAHRVGKNIILDLADAHLLIHLAMTGRLLLRKPEQAPDKWERVVLTLEKNNKFFELRFCDMRMFGKVELHTQSDFRNLVKKYGPEPLDTSLTPEEFLKRLQKKKSNIKNVLMDQNIVAGMGNAYVNDALWLAKINPLKSTKDLSLADTERLLEASRLILNEGIKNRGISMSDYVDLFGKKGSQQEHFRVYKQKECPTCQSKVEFVILSGRGTYYCPSCQSLN